MTQLTVRGFDRALERQLKRVAREMGLSLSQAAIELMRRGAGLEPQKGAPPRIGTAIDRFVGTLSRDDAAALDKAVEQFEVIDPALWR